MDFKILLESINPALRSIARKYVLYGFYDIEDLYQEMCLFLWQNYSEGLPIGQNTSYVTKACEFHILNFLRKGRQKANLSSLDKVTEDGVSLRELVPDMSSLSNTSDNNITIEDIKSIGLTKKEDEVFSLLLKGHTVREAAKILGISHVMVLKHKKSIIKKCKKKGYQK